MDLLKKYFPELSPEQLILLEKLGPLYQDWNQKINVISRKDIDNLYAHHILHSLAITKEIQFNDGAQILDLGTGGGLPGIPLAIYFPKVNFTLIDSTRKKLVVVEEIVSALGLTNVKTKHTRAEELKQKFDFVICRAVAPLNKLKTWSNRLIQKKQLHALPNGLLTLKGGDIQSEINSLPKGEYIEVFPLKTYFEEEYYDKKYLIYLQW